MGDMLDREPRLVTEGDYDAAWHASLRTEAVEIGRGGVVVGGLLIVVGIAAAIGGRALGGAREPLVLGGLLLGAMILIAQILERRRELAARALLAAWAQRRGWGWDNAVVEGALDGKLVRARVLYSGPKVAVRGLAVTVFATEARRHRSAAFRDRFADEAASVERLERSVGLCVADDGPRTA
jgi:hypothetical protein